MDEWDETGMCLFLHVGQDFPVCCLTGSMQSNLLLV